MKDPPRIYRQGGTGKQSNQAETQEEPKRLRPEVFRDAKRLVEEEKLPENRVAVPATIDSYQPMVEILTPRNKKKRQAVVEQRKKQDENAEARRRRTWSAGSFSSSEKLDFRHAQTVHCSTCDPLSVRKEVIDFGTTA